MWALFIKFFIAKFALNFYEFAFKYDCKYCSAKFTWIHENSLLNIYVTIIVSIVHQIDFHLDEKFVLFQFVDALIRVIKISWNILNFSLVCRCPYSSQFFAAIISQVCRFRYVAPKILTFMLMRLFRIYNTYSWVFSFYFIWNIFFKNSKVHFTEIEVDLISR